MTSDRTLNLEALLDTVYRLQVDLTLLAEQLARARNPDMSDGAILDLVTLTLTVSLPVDFESNSDQANQSVSAG